MLNFSMLVLKVSVSIEVALEEPLLEGGVDLFLRPVVPLPPLLPDIVSVLVVSVSFPLVDWFTLFDDPLFEESDFV